MDNGGNKHVSTFFFREFVLVTARVSGILIDGGAPCPEASSFAWVYRKGFKISSTVCFDRSKAFEISPAFFTLVRRLRLHFAHLI